MIQYLNKRRVYQSGGFDIDALNLIIAASIIDVAEKEAVNKFFVDLKSNGLYDLITAGYLCVGSTYNSMKFNLKNPLDTNAAFRLSQSGNISYSSNGIKADGSTGYLNTHLRPNTNIGGVLNHISYYINENIKNDAFIGVGDGNKTLQLYPRGVFFNDQTKYYNGAVNLEITTQPVTDSKGFYMNNRYSSTEFKGVKNGVSTPAISNTIGVQTDLEVYLSARNLNNGTASGFDNRQWCYASIGLGMTDAQALTYYNIVQEFQTFKNRQV